ncbi:GT4 family glycosyltransferase PelF [Kineococcus indalonis]|uniref:GT4 family glycosyltransferase PelF n=1 Tax=Kineococcus indalonis TaxID=2696566 RepID=UPI00196A297F|nr:GT4 family glycosyltransferase PelF [Kineococcus indalonis]
MYSTHRSNGRDAVVTTTVTETTAAGTTTTTTTSAGPTTAAPTYADVDVAIVMESTYPYLKGGVSAVVHDIVRGNQDLTFGIIHITWDSRAPHEDLYGVPDNVKWIAPVYLSMQEHREDFMSLTPSRLGMRAPARRRLAHRVVDALEAVVAGDVEPLWRLYDEGMNPRTQKYPIWALLGTREFMEVLRDRLPQLGLPLTDTFWLMREFFSLAFAVLSVDAPRARVYHAHTTGYASLLGAAAARQHGTRFLLTEHNLYVRDTVNTLLERSMALPLTAEDYRTFDVTPTQRAWMAWWTEMGRFCYPSAETITYLYPDAVTEAADLGAPVERSVVVPNGMVVREFDEVARRREEALADILSGDPGRTWRFVYIARVVPIKGLADLVDSVALLVGRGVTNFVVDVLGPTDHTPDYYMLCRDKMRRRNVEDHFVFHGVVDVRRALGDFDALVLPSYNEGQPIVVLEAMTAGIPTVGTEVGGMAQLVGDTLTTGGGREWGECGLLVEPGAPEQMADGMQRLMEEPALYERLARNARGRVDAFFQLEDAVGAYNRLYKELGGLEVTALESGPQPAGEEHRVVDLRPFDAPHPPVLTPEQLAVLRRLVAGARVEVAAGHAGTGGPDGAPELSAGQLEALRRFVADGGAGAPLHESPEFTAEQLAVLRRFAGC